MAVSVTATTTSGLQLDDTTLKLVTSGASQIIQLDQARQRILEYVESRMSVLCPNLQALLGSSVAARLVGAAHGLNNLCKLPSSTLVSLGAHKATSVGGSAYVVVGSVGATATKHVGILADADLIHSCPSMFRSKAIRVLSGKCILAARVDAFKEDVTGSNGQSLREEVERKIEKWQEPPPIVLPKALPAPDDRPKKRRGGKRANAIKDKYRMTEMRKQMNRVPFGLEEQKSVGNTSKTLGMLGLSGSGKVRITAQDKGILKKQKINGRTSGNASGLSSSIAFTPVQGLELVDPEAAARRVREANLNYFGSSTFNKS
eukprot:TRINITY_DN6042_c0_g1_i1.p1 TRINITY_DN6042_c0_g1~~TRINITY_DN6042_c0_g1_i1.p1  ORF type:complete len:317 (-),score=75.54 TRINITY_DN6042_c0_g1_i1:35-985(-)